MKLGRNIHEIYPSKINARNSEGAFFTLNNGDVIFCYSKFRTSADDESASDLSLLVSHDNGETFGEERILFSQEQFDTKEKKCTTIMSPCFMRMQDGAMGIFLLVRYDAELHEHVLRSYDEGVSWSSPIRCCPFPGYYVTNNDRVVRLRNGRIIVPASYHRPSAENMSGIACFFISDDDGFTWREAKEFCVIQDSDAGLQEPGVIELSENHLFGFARTARGTQYGMYSHDGGKAGACRIPRVFIRRIHR